MKKLTCKSTRSQAPDNISQLGRFKNALQLSLFLFLFAGSKDCIGAEIHKAQSDNHSGKAEVSKPEANKNRSCSAALEEAQRFLISKRFADADARFAQAKECAATNGAKKQLLSCLIAIALYRSRQGSLDDEYNAVQEVLKFAEKDFSNESPEYATALELMAAYYARKGESSSCRNYQEQAGKILALQKNSFPFISSLAALAEARRFIAEGSPGLADDQFKEVLKLQESTLKTDDPCILLSLLEYADLLDKIDRKTEAENLRKRVSLAKANFVLASEQKNAALVLKSAQGSSPEAKFNKLIEEAMKEGNNKNTDKAISLFKLAAQEAEKNPAMAKRQAFALLRAADMHLSKEPQEAETLYRKSLSIYENLQKGKALGEARCLIRLSQIAGMSSRSQQAKDLLTKALEIEKASQASQQMQAACLQSLLSACMSSKSYGEAERAAKQLLEISEKQSGMSAALNKRMALSMLGSLYMQSGRMNEGMKLMQEVANSMKSAEEDSKQMASSYGESYAAIEKEFDESDLSN